MMNYFIEIMLELMEVLESGDIIEDMENPYHRAVISILTTIIRNELNNDRITNELFKQLDEIKNIADKVK
jgi:hypothetical protein